MTQLASTYELLAASRRPGPAALLVTLGHGTGTKDMRRAAAPRAHAHRKVLAGLRQAWMRDPTSWRPAAAVLDHGRAGAVPVRHGHSGACRGISAGTDLVARP
jgi:hypothetical protein